MYLSIFTKEEGQLTEHAATDPDLIINGGDAMVISAGTQARDGSVTGGGFPLPGV